MKRLTWFFIILLNLTITSGCGQSINDQNLVNLLSICDSTKADEILISNKGKVIKHWKRSSFDNCLIVEGESSCEGSVMNTASMLKSWVGLLVGISIDKGLIESVESPICKYLPEWESGCVNEITVKHLLTMTAGIKNAPAASSILASKDMNSFVLNVKPDTLPEIGFSYSNESVQLLGLLIEKVTQKKLDKVFDEWLFQKLNMNSTHLSKDDAGNVVAFGGCQTSIQDVHNLALMMLNKGTFNGQRIVSETWIDQAVTPSTHASYYGFLWWLDKNSDPWNYAATGDLGNMMIIFPEIDLIFLRRQSCDMSRQSKTMAWMGPPFITSISEVVHEN